MTEIKYDKRSGIDRRIFSPYLHVPERRSGKDRRKLRASIDGSNRKPRSEGERQKIQ